MKRGCTRPTCNGSTFVNKTKPKNQIEYVVKVYFIKPTAFMGFDNKYVPVVVKL